MIEKTKVRRFGGSLGILLPKALAGALALEEDDELFLVNTPNGLHVTPYDPEFAAAMADALAFMRSHRDALRGLST